MFSSNLSPKELLPPESLTLDKRLYKKEVEPIAFPDGVDENEMKYLSPNEIKTAMNKGFYFSLTIKSPFLLEKESYLLIKLLIDKQLN